MMLPTLLRCLRWKARLPTQGTIPFRPYVMIPKPGQAKSLHSSARASKKKTSSWKSTAFTYGCVIIVFTKMYFEDRFKPYNMVLSLYHKLNGALLHPSYQPIQSENEIRLLILEPGKGNEPIRCRLKNVLLSDKPKYEALSYVRGRCYGFMGQDYIYCEGQLVKIGKELSYALESLRLPDHERILWTDALCINQSDNVEKGHQVNIMGDIYSSSQKVLIWLGKASRRTAGTFDSLKELDKEFRKVYEGYEDLPLYGFVALSKPGLSKADFQRLILRYDHEPLLELIRHPWYHRVWTLQEVAKAPAATIVHGAQSMPASEFFRPISCMLHALTCIVAESAEIFALDYAKAAELGDRIFDNQGFENLSDSQPRPYLYMVSSNSPNRVATDPRDRIYAFRSVANDHDLSDFELRPDYEASVEEVYSRFARWCLFKKNDMSYLAHAGMPYQHEGPPSHTEDIPSWVADWTRKERPDFGDYFLLTLKPFKAGSALEPTISWEPNRPRLLFIKGRVVDTVTELAVNMEDLTQYYKVLMSFYQGKAFKTWLRWVFYGLYPPTRHMTPGLQEAHQAVAKYGPMKGPLYHLEEVIWMENCKAIATRALGSVSPTRSDVFWRTMMRDRTLWGAEKASPDLGNRFGEYLDFLNLVRSGELRPSIQSAVPLGEYLEMEEPMTKAQVPPVNSPSLTVGVLPLIQFPYKRFCSTAEGRLGWVPNCAKPGDLICVFDGVTVPFVIRPRIEVTVPKESSLVYWRRQLSGYFSSSVETKPESQPEYVLVGECYVHGLMDGEAMDRQDVESELITLS